MSILGTIAGAVAGPIIKWGAKKIFGQDDDFVGPPSSAQSVISGVVDAAGDAAGGYLSNKYSPPSQSQEYNRESAATANEFAAAQAERNRQFQAEMSNTSYQRAVGDMKSAGLNPMLAYSQGGASTPSGSAASASNASPGEDAVMQALQLKNMALQGQKIEADIAYTQAATEGQVATAAQARQSTENARAQLPRIKMELEEIQTKIENMKKDGRLTEEQIASAPVQRALLRAQTEVAYADRALKAGQLSLAEASAIVQRAEGILKMFEVPGAALKAGAMNDALEAYFAGKRAARDVGAPRYRFRHAPDGDLDSVTGEEFMEGFGRNAP